jgi:hypothetical protein
MIDLNKLIEFIVELYYKFINKIINYINNKKLNFEKFNPIKSVKKAATSVVKYIPIPKASYVPKTYTRDSYGRGAGLMPFTIKLRPYKPGIKASRY